MITASEENYLGDHAYVPEHLPGYGTAFSGGEPFLLEDYLYYHGRGVLIFIGYPLRKSFDEAEMRATLQKVLKRLRPSQVAIMAPSFSNPSGGRKSSDSYYRLKISPLRIPGKVKNMIHRASREVQVEKSRQFKEEHHKLVSHFLASHKVEEETRNIFGKIPGYIAAVPTAWIFNARDSAGRLAGFDVGEFGAKDYAFYLFNFRSREAPVPGTSDLLLFTMIESAREQGKSHINLGLGISEGVAFFKKKWGGRPFLRHEFFLLPFPRFSPLESILQGFFRS